MTDVRERTPPPYPGERQRSFRCPDDIWEEAVALAADLGESLSQRLREYLVEYIKEGRKRR